MMVNYFNQIILKLFVSKNRISKNESLYYEDLFIKNKRWSSEYPNDEERIRWQHVKMHIDKYISTSASKISILDLGCGRGWMVKLLESYGDTVGFDPVYNVVKHAQKIFPKSQFFVGSYSDVKNKCGLGKFDLIVSSEVIEHIMPEFKNDFVNTINGLLKPNGFLILTTPRLEVLMDFVKYSNAAQPIEEWMSEISVSELFLSNNSSIIDRSRIQQCFDNDKCLDLYQVWVFKKTN